MSGYSNTVSLSSNVLTWLYESNWCVASRRTQHAEKATLREDILDSTFDRPAALYHLHNGLSTVVREVATIATYILVSPVGVVYHTTQAFKHHFQSFSSDGNRHFHCAGVELLRVAGIVSVFYAIYTSPLLSPILRHRIDLTLAGYVSPLLNHSVYRTLAGYVSSLLNHSVCRTLAGYVAPHVDFTRLYNTLQRVMGTLVGVILVDLTVTIFNPIYNSRILDASDQDVSWRGKMAFKWELGIKGKGYKEELENKIVLFAKDILQTIGKLQRLLPTKHKLPYDLDVQVHRLLRYLEDSRKELDPEQWDQIRPLRDNLERYNTVMFRLKPYLSIDEHLKTEFPKVGLLKNEIKDTFGKLNLSHESQVEQAFEISRYEATNNATFEIATEIELNGKREDITRTVLKKRPISLLRIHAFTQTLFKKMLSSNFLYPSNVYSQQVDDLGCIQDTMSRIDPYEHRTAVTTWHHRPLKLIRFIARKLANVVILGLGCPLGAIGHGAKSLRYLASYVLGSRDDRFGNWERVQAHARAMFDDMRSIFGIFDLLLKDVNGAVNAFATRVDRAGMIKAIELKNTFGITRKDGGLLYYSSDDDIPKEGHFDPYFVGLYCNRSLVFVAKLKLLHESLSKEYQVELEFAFKEFMRCGSVSHFETILATDEGQKGSSQLANVNALQQKKRECFQALKDLVEIWHVVINVFQVTENEVVSPPDARRTIRPCAFAPKLESEESSSTQNSWWKDHKLEREWLSTLETTQKAIRDLSVDKASEEIHDALKQRVMAQDAMPKSILGFDENEEITHKTVAQKFRALAFIFHSDKLSDLPEELKKEKTELFKILSVAKTMLTVNLPKDEV